VARGASGSEAPSLGEGARRALVRITAARLALAIGALAVAGVFIGVGRQGAEAAETALYGVLAAGFLWTAVFAAALPFVRRPARLGALQLFADVALVTALVHFSGGADSFFGFLYLPITLYGAILFERRGAYGSAVLASAGYGLALWTAEVTGTRALFGGALPGTPLSALWVVHTAALLLEALLGTALARELRITGERLEESASDLQRLRDLHERTVESLTSGLLTTDLDGRVTSFNPEAERITGRAARDALGLDVEQVLPGAREAVLVPRRPGARTRARMVFRDGSGQERRLGLSGSVLRSAEGEPGGWVVIFQDVTDVVRMEADLRRSERLAATGQLAANMAHEIRNPLAAISGSLEMLRARADRPSGGPERQRLMEIALREIERLDHLIADFLEFARPAAGEPAPLPLAPAVEELAKMFEAVRPPGVALRLDVPRDCAVLADPRQLRQVLWNLLLNAAQALPEGGEIRIVARPVTDAPQDGATRRRNASDEGEQSVEVAISDTGVGMPPEVLERAFEPFFTTKRSGSGLGLPTVHRVVENHGGSLSLESRRGEGTTVRVRLPAAEVRP
jgi:two-component system sensor histidine kinase PilS (NtrC family)